MMTKTATLWMKINFKGERIPYFNAFSWIYTGVYIKLYLTSLILQHLQVRKKSTHSLSTIQRLVVCISYGFCFSELCLTSGDYCIFTNIVRLKYATVIAISWPICFTFLNYSSINTTKKCKHLDPTPPMYVLIYN